MTEFIQSNPSHESPTHDNAFPSWRRIHGQKQFELIFRHGVKITTPLFSVWCFLSEVSFQIAVLTPKKIGNSVVRHRSKRLVKEFLRHHWMYLPKKGQILLRIEKPILLWSEDLSSHLFQAIQKIEKKAEKKKLRSQSTAER